MIAMTIAACGSKGGTDGADDGGDGGVDAAVDGGSTADANPGCGLVTCASQGATCGPIGDGCGGVLDCGTCTPPESCGGGGIHFTCGGGDGGGGGTCTPLTCAQANAECGQIADGCGGLTPSCGTCPSGEVCGGGAVPNVCAATSCTGLCQQIEECPGMPQTTITGTVTAPGHTDTALWGTPDPIYGALVYIPNGAAGPPNYGVEPFTSGVSCDSCSSLVTGSPLLGVVTGVDGTFTLTAAPCGTDIPLVIQLGRWRRQITIPNVACCATTALTNTQTHLPRNHVGEPGDVRSDIPLFAVSTGDVDTLHCVLRKIGIEDSEFTNPGGGGRVHLYEDNGAVIDTVTPAASSLYGNASVLDDYDMVLFECVGSRVAKQLVDQNRVISYANAGGRVFTTHFSYVWLTNDTPTTTSTAPAPFFQTADWQVTQGNADSTLGLVDQTPQGDPATQLRRIAFANWLQLVGASTVLGAIPVNVVRQDFSSVNPTPATASGTPAQLWLHTTDAFTGPLHYTFDTPVAYPPNPPPTTQCGRVLFSDFHVSDATSGGQTFPSECNDGPMDAQEKTLEFMLFDLASCVGPPPPAICAPRTCADQGNACGLSGTGCDDGVVLDCGTCPMGYDCLGGACLMDPCIPLTCADAGAACGIVGDGCGATVDCGLCPDGQTCGAGGPNQCGTIVVP